MAAARHTAIDQDFVFSCTLQASDLLDGWPGGGPPPPFPHVHACPLTALFCAFGGATATIAHYAAAALYDPQGAPSCTLPDIALGSYSVYTFTATVPGDSDLIYLAIHLGDGCAVYPPGPHPLPGPLVTEDFTVAVEVTLSGLYLFGSTVDATPADRGFLWFEDRTYRNSWYYGPGTEVQLAYTPSWGGGATLTGDLAPGGGGYAEAGQNFGASVGIDMAGFPSEDTVYARVAGPNLEGAIDLSNLDLYSPGTNPPDGDESEWGRTVGASVRSRVDDVSGIAMFHQGGGGAGTSADWTGDMYLPLKPVFAEDTGNHDTRVGRSDIDVAGTPLEWYLDRGFYVSRPLVFSGGLSNVERRLSWEWPYEWQKFSSNTMALNVDQPWRVANKEDVGDSTDSQDDRAVALYFHPLDVDDMGDNPLEEWSTFLTMVHDSSRSVLAPSDGKGRPNRPQDWWVGSGGLTPGAGSATASDTWAVALGSATPKATLTLASRYFTRLARLADYAADTAYHWDQLSILNRDNVDEWSAIGFLDPVSERIAEHVWHWNNFSYLTFTFTVPAARVGTSPTVAVRVNWSEVAIDDPWYTCFGYRFGTDGEYTYTRTQKNFTYTMTLTQVSGATYQGRVDLYVPLSGDLAAMLHHIDSVEVTMPTAAADETWVLQDVVVGLDPTVSGQVHLGARVYDPYDWLSDYTGLSGLVDGKQVLNIPYGYEGMERTERSLKIRQKRRHCPSCGGCTGILDYAKAAAATAAELTMQRGWVGSSYPSPAPEASAKNKDPEDNLLVGTFRTFDVRTCEVQAFDSSQTFKGAPVAGSLSLAAGITQMVKYRKYPQGRRHQFVAQGSRAGRERETGTWYMWQREGSTDTTWASVAGPQATDKYGRVEFPPQKESYGRDGSDNALFYEYAVTDDSLEPEAGAGVFNLYNRRYQWGLGEDEPTGKRVHAAKAPWGGIVVVHPSEVKWPGEADADTPRTWVDNWVSWVSGGTFPEVRGYVAASKNPTVAIGPDGFVYIILESTGGAVLYSYRTGPTGQGGVQVAEIPGYTCPTATRRPDTGDLVLLAIDDATSVAKVLRGTDRAATWTVIGDLGNADKVPGGIVATDQGNLYAFKVEDDTVKPYESLNDGKTWTAR